MPPRNNPRPDAIRNFHCDICDKGYSRQVEFENHLRSYDHNHRQRLVDVKKTTASYDTESTKPKKGLEMRRINVNDANKKPGVGSRFTKIGATEAPAAGGGRFKKVGVTVGGTKDGQEQGGEMKEVGAIKVEAAEPMKSEEKASSAVAVSGRQVETKKDEDTVMADGDEQEDVTWEEYDFTKPTGCDHANCPGCKTDGIWSGKWVSVGTALKT